MEDFSSENGDLEVGVERTLILDGVAHRGYAVGRDSGRVVFVRGGIPGEVVRVRITRRGPKGRFWYADTLRVLEASADRVVHPWPIAALASDDDGAHPVTAPVGGLDLGHISLAGGRHWKGEVVRDQLRKIGRLTWPEVVVEAAPGDEENSGLRWRTRVQLAVDAQGRAGMRPHRSHDVIALDELPIAVPAIAQLDLFGRKWPPGAKLQIALPSASAPFIAVNGQPWNPGKGASERGARRASSAPQRRYVREKVTAQVAGQAVTAQFQVAGTGFWQVHRLAPQILAEAVLKAADVQVGEHVIDLYAGVGLFAKFLHAVIGPTGRITAIESDANAMRAARRNFHAAKNVDLVTADVRHLARNDELPKGSVVVLDPPRAGAGAEVVRAIAARHPRKIVHVSCDPATFARDVRTYYELGWQMTELRAFDLYPLTHHVETLGVFQPVVS